MKIALICEFFPESSGREMRGGVEARTYFMGRGLAKRHDVTVYSVKEPGFTNTSIDGMDVVRVGPEMKYTQASSLPDRIRFMRDAAEQVKGFDVVDGASVIGYPAAWWSKCPVKTVTYHDVWVGRWIRNIGWKGAFGELMERYVLSRRWNLVTAVSEYTKQNLVKHGVDAEKITVAPNGIDVREYAGVKAEKFDKPTVCTVARLVKYKRVGDLIQAAANMKEDVPGLQVKVVGTGPERKTLERLARDLGVDADFMGYVPKHSRVLETVKASHAFCLPSAVEGYGITVVEAMALDVPYVASDIPAVREATRNGSGGLLYETGNIGKLADGLKTVLQGGVEGGVDFIGEYEWSRTVEKVEEAYERASDIK